MFFVISHNKKIFLRSHQKKENDRQSDSVADFFDNSEIVQSRCHDRILHLRNKKSTQCVRHEEDLYDRRSVRRLSRSGTWIAHHLDPHLLMRDMHHR